MSHGYTFEGWMGHDKESAKGKLVWQQFEPKPWEETDVDIQVLFEWTERLADY